MAEWFKAFHLKWNLIEIGSSNLPLSWLINMKNKISLIKFKYINTIYFKKILANDVKCELLKVILICKLNNLITEKDEINNQIVEKYYSSPIIEMLSSTILSNPFEISKVVSKMIILL